jgi:hypothetical protein
LIKQYLGGFSFSLEVRHSLEFYNIIGEEEKKFLAQEKDKFAGKEGKTEENMKTNQPKPLIGKVLPIGGKKPIKKGGKMKDKQK